MVLRRQREYYFNSRPSARGDCPPKRSCFCQRNFNSRPSARGDVTASFGASSEMYFNSRPSARGDTPRRRKQQTKAYFNSRPSARGDSKHGERYTPTPISIHAPPRGATRQSLKGCEFPEFQFTPLREGRLLTSKGMQEKLAISIHAPPRGATIPRMDGRRSAGNFNSRPSARGDIRGI